MFVFNIRVKCILKICNINQLNMCAHNGCIVIYTNIGRMSLLGSREGWKLRKCIIKINKNHTKCFLFQLIINSMRMLS